LHETPTARSFTTFLLLFAYIFDKKMDHNMLALMLDPRLKSLQLVTNYIDHENASTLVAQYDE